MGSKLRFHALFLVIIIVSSFLLSLRAQAAAADAEPSTPAVETETQPQTPEIAFMQPQVTAISRPLKFGDKVNIRVYRENDLSGSYTVDNQGKINFPLLGEVQAKGLKVEELKDYLLRTLGEDYLVNPQISIVFEGGLNDYVSVLGEVERPGNFIYDLGKTLLSTISAAGGLSKSASETATIIRNKDDETTVLKFDVSKIIKGEIPDPPLQPGDVVSIEARAGAAPEDQEIVSVLGQAKKAGTFPFTPGLTVAQVISQAQGFSEISDPTKVKLTRGLQSGSTKTFTVNVLAIVNGRATDVKLEKGDIIYIPESAF